MLRVLMRSEADALCDSRSLLPESDLVTWVGAFQSAVANGNDPLSCSWRQSSAEPEVLTIDTYQDSSGSGK